VFLSLWNEDHPSLLILRQEKAYDFPNIAHSFCVKYECFLRISTKIESHFLQSTVNISERQVRNANIVQIHKKVILFSMIRYHSVS
jgi:hypothetical protein